MSSEDKEDVAALERILHRLAVAEDERLGTVLDKLLPRLIATKLDGSEAVRAQALEVLSHVLRRTKPNALIPLPCLALADVVSSAPPASHSLNFSVVFLEVGMPRMSAVEQGEVALTLVQGLSKHARHSHIQTQLLYIIQGALQAFNSPPTPTLASGDVAELSDWFLDLALWGGPPPSSAGTGGSALPSPTPGMSKSGILRLMHHEPVWGRVDLTRERLSVLRALRRGLLPPAARIRILLPLSCDTRHEIADQAESQLKAIMSSPAATDIAQDSFLASQILRFIVGEGVLGKPRTDGERCPCPAVLAMRAANFAVGECAGGVVANVVDGARVVFHCLLTLKAFDIDAMRLDLNVLKVQAAGARLAAFLCARCPPAKLPAVGGLLLKAVQEFIRRSAAHRGQMLQMATSAAVHMAAEAQEASALESCYEAIASLASSSPSLCSKDTSLLHLLFHEFVGVTQSHPSLRVRISAALGGLRSAFRDPVASSPALEGEVWGLLWTAARNDSEDRARLSALDWAVGVFPFSHPVARHLCAYLSGDSMSAVLSAAERGLAPPLPGMAYPSFTSFVEQALADTPCTGLGISAKSLSPLALASALEFSTHCEGLANAAPNVTDIVLARIEEALGLAPSPTVATHHTVAVSSLHLAAVQCLCFLLQEEAERRTSVSASMAIRYAHRGPWLEQWLSHESSTDIRTAFATVAGYVSRQMDERTQLAPFMRSLAASLDAAKDEPNRRVTNRIAASAHGAACALGATLAGLAPRANGDRMYAWAELAPSALMSLTGLISHPVSLIHEAACAALGDVGELAALPLPYKEQLFSRLQSACVLGETEDASRRAEGAVDALGRICQGLNCGPTSPSLSQSSTFRLTSLRTFLALSKVQKEEELQFSVGEALGRLCLSGMLLISSEDASDGSGQEVGEHQGVDAMDHVLERIVGHDGIIHDNSPHVTGTAALYLLCIVKCTSALSSSVHPALTSHRMLELQSTFIKQLTHRNDFIQEVAGRGLAMVYQVASTSEKRQELADALAQELCAGRTRATAVGVDVNGMSQTGARSGVSEGGSAYAVMFSLAADIGKPELMYFLLAMAGENSAWATRRGVHYGLTEIMGRGNVAASSDAVTAILQRELGPHLSGALPRIYSARHDPNPKTRALMEKLWRIVAAGDEAKLVKANFRSIIEGLFVAIQGRKWRERQSSCLALADLLRGQTWVSVGPYLIRCWDMADRALDDLKETVMAAAGQMAKTLVTVSVRLCDPGSSASADDAEADAAVPSANSGEEAERGIGPLGSIVAGGHEEIMREAERFARSLDISPSPDEPMLRKPETIERSSRPVDAVRAADSSEAVTLLLPWLLNHGLMSKCKLSAALSMRVLQKIVAVADGRALQPHLALLIAMLLEGLSALEPQALQYMQFHAERDMNTTPEKMEQLRLSLSRAGPLQEALDTCCWHLNGEGGSSDVINDLIPKLVGLLRGGVGLATRAGVARLILTLCQRAPKHIEASAARLLPALANASLPERSPTLRSSYRSAIAAVARNAPQAAVLRLSARLCQIFSTSDPALDSQLRCSVSSLLSGLAEKASPSLGAGSQWSNTGWSELLPLAFIARHDNQESIAKDFQAIWTAGLSAVLGGEAETGDAPLRGERDVVALMLPSLEVELARALAGTTSSVRRQACLAVVDICKHDLRLKPQLVRQILTLIPGRCWEGKEVLSMAIRSLCLSEADGQGSITASTVMEMRQGDDRGQSEPKRAKTAGEGAKDGTEGEGVQDILPEADASAASSEVVDIIGNLFSEDVCEASTGESAPLDTSQLAPVTMGDITALLLKQLEKRVEPESALYRRATADALTGVMQAFSSCDVYGYVSPVLLQLARLGSSEESSSEAESADSVLEARALDCLAAAWEGAAEATRREYARNLVRSLVLALPVRVWTVRVSLLSCLRAILDRSMDLYNGDTAATRPTISSTDISKVVQGIMPAVSDEKYSACREAAMGVVLVLSLHHKDRFVELTPHRETLEELARARATDSEPRVAALAARVLQAYIC
jgi:hypothetical protein